MRITRHPLLVRAGGLRDVPADEAVIRRLVETWPLLDAQRGDAWARFGRRLRLEAPALAALLPSDAALRSAGDRVLDAVGVVVGNLRNLDAARAELRRLARELEAHRGGSRLRSADIALLIRLFVVCASEAAGARLSPEIAEEWTRALELMAVLLREATDETVDGFMTLR